MENSFQFMGILYPTRAAMLHAIAREWITGGGSIAVNSPEARQELAASDPAALAAECAREWQLDDRGDFDEPDAPTHMEEHGYSLADLADAFKTVAGRTPLVVATPRTPPL